MTDTQEDMLKAVEKHGRVTVPMMASQWAASRHKVRGLLERLTRDGRLIKETERKYGTFNRVAYYRLKS